MQCHKNFLMMITLFLYCVSCANEQVKVLPEGTSSNSIVSTDAPFDQEKLIQNRGHVVFKIDPQDAGKISIKSLQQPFAATKKISETDFVLVDLLVQKHTLIVERIADGEKQFAVFTDVDIEANKYIEIGQIAFQKAGSARGRLLSTDASQALNGIKVFLPELSEFVSTSESGEFLFKNIPPGKWTLRATIESKGFEIQTIVGVISGEEASMGELWLGDPQFSAVTTEIVNGANNITANAKAEFKFQFPPGTRYVSIKTKEGLILLDKVVAKQFLAFDVPESMKTVLEIFVYNAERKLMGVSTVPFQFDPFSQDGVAYVPNIRVAQRVVKSPQRTISVDLSSRPLKAHRVRFGFDSFFGEWLSPMDTMTVEIPKSNLSCGQRMLNFQFETDTGHESAIFSLPVTLSCWERIPNRAALDKLVGIDNAAVWTGTHAFVWSGRQFTFGNRAGPWGGSNSFETVEHQRNLQTYQYLDGGYVYRPVQDPITKKYVSDMEFIVTDNAPVARALAGVAGRNHLVAVYGGENADGPIADGAIFDINMNGWVSMMAPGAPAARIKPSVFFLDDTRVMVWGGRTRTNLGFEIALNDGAIYNLETHQWAPISMVNAPSPRFSHLGLVGQSKLYVFGGQLLGGSEVYAGGIYDFSTGIWQSVSLDFATSSMSAIMANDNIIFFGANKILKILSLRDWSTNTFPVIGNNNLMINPQMAIDGDGTGPSESFLYLYGGRNSLMGNDVSDEFLRLVYKYDLTTGHGSILTSDSRNKVVAAKDAFGSTVMVSTYYPAERCCLNSLGFIDNKNLLVMNGTIVTNTSMSQKSGFLSFGTGSAGSNYTEIFPVTLSNLARYFYYNDASGGLTAVHIDWARNADDSSRSPHYLYRTDPPVWNPTNRTLMFYGGLYKHYLQDKTQQGGFLYNVDTKNWSRLPVATTEMKQYDFTFNSNRYYSRNDSLRFLIDGEYYILGGFYHWLSGNNVSRSTNLYTGLKLTFTDGIPNSPEALDFTSLPLDFSLKTHAAHYVTDKFRLNPACVVGKQVLLTGGVRELQRNTSGLDESSALLQDKVIFDGAIGTLRKASDGPLGARAGLTAVSTGHECFIWGGYTADSAFYTSDLNTELRFNAVPQGSGAIYSFETNEWSEVPQDGAPSARALMHGVWTGQDVLMWGGTSQISPSLSLDAREGQGVWRYHPGSRKWTNLPSVKGEPNFMGMEVPLWLGSHLFIWKTRESDFSYFFNPETNSWSRLAVPFGFGFRATGADDGSKVVWTGEKVFVMPYYDGFPALMAFFVPPDP